MKKIIAALGIIIMAFPALVLAGNFQSGSASTVARGESIQGNLYSAGGNVSILGNVEEGDLYTAGGNVTVAGNVSNDLVAVGGTVNILGDVGDDLRVAGGNVTIGSKIDGELMAAGGQINIVPGTEIMGMAKIGGGDIVLDGTFNDGIQAAGETITINGSIKGNADITATKKLVVNEGASIEGDLNYKSPVAAEISTGASIGGKSNFQETTFPRDGRKNMTDGKFFSFLGAWWFAQSLMLFIAALLLVHFYRRRLSDMVERAASNFGKETLRGLLVFLLVPALVFILAVSILFFLPAFFILAIYAALLVFASIFKPIMVGSWTYRKIYKAQEFRLDWKTVFLGVLIVQVFRYIPFVGWLFDLVVFMAALGTASFFIWKFLKGTRDVA